MALTNFPQTLSKNGVTTNLQTGIRTYADGSTERLTGGALDMSRRAGGWADSGLAGHIQSGQPGDFSGDSTYYAAGTYPGAATGLQPSSSGASGATTGTHNNSYGGAVFGGSSGSSAPTGGVMPPPGSGVTGGVMPQPGAAGGLGGTNPYLQPMMDSITSQVTNNFNRNVMPAISSGAMAAGNFGGSRQGVIEANAMNDLNQGLSGALANLGLQDFNAMRGYDLGLRGNDLGFAGLDAQINQNNFNNRLQGANFGLGLWNQGMANNQTGINAGTNIQNTPMNYWSQFGNQYNSIGQGFGTTTGSASQQGNPMMGALGGAQLGSQIGNWWGGGGGTGMTGSNAPASSYNIGSFDYGIGGGGGGGLGLKF